MTNTDALNAKIADSGLKMEYIAQSIGISRFALYNKINNNTEFKTGEVKEICALLKINSPAERDFIFFA